MESFARDQWNQRQQNQKQQSQQQNQQHGNQQEQATFTQTNLVSDGFVNARTIDPNLINPWGVSFSPTGPFWVSDNGTGVTTIYNGDGTPAAPAGHPVITIATASDATGPAAPTGQVFNSTGSGFEISSGGNTASSIFMFATEDGTISGWNPAVNGGASTVLAVDNSQEGLGAVYKGLALGQTSDGPRLFAADFRNAQVDVFDQKFQQVGSFTDKKLPAGYAPFNVQVLDNKLFVTFALQDADKVDDVPGPGHGFVDEFDLNGKLLDRVASGGPLDSPWGLAIAPSGFGDVANDLLVGNFGDGTINVFDPNNDHFLGKLLGADGNPIVIGDLWALTPSNNSPAAAPNAIYFTAGLEQEAHGLFGTLTATQEAQQLPAQGAMGTTTTQGTQPTQGAMGTTTTTQGTQPSLTAAGTSTAQGTQPSLTAAGTTTAQGTQSSLAAAMGMTTAQGTQPTQAAAGGMASVLGTQQQSQLSMGISQSHI